MRLSVFVVGLVACQGSTPAPQPAPTPAPAEDVPEQVEEAVESPKEPVRPTARMSFQSVDVPTALEDQLELFVSESWTMGEQEHPLKWKRLLTDGDAIGGAVFGSLVDASGQPLTDAEGAPRVCNGPDFGAIMDGPSGPLHVSHIECVPGAIYVTALSQDEEGELTATATAPVDMSAVGGGMVHCAADITPWGTLLSSEEYEPDARAHDPVTGAREEGWPYAPMAEYLGAEVADVNVYDYGWIPEVTPGPSPSQSSVVKHYAMGRFSHEVGRVAGDGGTVFLSDDGDSGGFYMFLADEDQDLSAGSLYAMRWTQRDNTTDGLADVHWVPLGHATNEDIAAKIRSGVRFADLFEAGDPRPDGTCAEGLTSIHTANGHECLAVREGMEQLASRLETRRYAAVLGATTELKKGEGVAFSRDTGEIYLAISQVAGGMLDGDDWDQGGPNHVRLPPNECGVVLAFETSPRARDTAGRIIPSRFVPMVARALVSGVPKTYTAPGLDKNTCDVDAIANPDNITYLPHYGLLAIAEDTLRHTNSALWMYDVFDGSLTRVLVAPVCSEVTGVHWTAAAGGKGYLSFSVQHPLRYKNKCAAPGGMADDPDSTRTWMGYLGPFPELRGGTARPREAASEATPDKAPGGAEARPAKAAEATQAPEPAE